ncbi:MAG: hypothetical protein L6W00_15640 [Lentisphaeria bacterium]|nr:MAG: hypothetical protein L6W00_15640 [Lentisphaeria bacterium]
MFHETVSNCARICRTLPLLFLSAAESPHGVCAHLCRGEFRDAEEEFGIFRELGLGGGPGLHPLENC